MDIVEIYQCLCDRTRLRILSLLGDGPLCVCHFQDILDEEQVKISKHLRYLKEHSLVESTREGNWMIYSLPSPLPRELKANLACLQDCVQDDAVFRRDREKLVKLKAALGEDCCAPRAVLKKTRPRRVT